MANILKVYTPANIHVGPADIYINITAPTSALIPTADNQTLTLSANGEPTSNTGFHAGLCAQPTMPTITEKLNAIMADQLEMPVDTGFDSIEAEIDLVLKEFNLSRFQTLLSDASLAAYNAITGQQALQIGGQTNSAATAITVLAVSPRRDVIGKFNYWMLYKAQLMSAIPLSFNRAKETDYKLKFKGFADLTRTIGDELMQVVRTK